jgi:hypothetical protein
MSWTIAIIIAAMMRVSCNMKGLLLFIISFNCIAYTCFNKQVSNNKLSPDRVIYINTLQCADYGDSRSDLCEFYLIIDRSINGEWVEGVSLNTCTVLNFEDIHEVDWFIREGNRLSI